MHPAIRVLVGLLLVPVIWGAVKMAVYGSVMSAFTNDHTSAADPIVAAVVALGCFIAPVWSLMRPGRKPILIGWFTLLFPLVFTLILARVLGFSAVLIVVWYLWSALAFRRPKNA